MNATKCILFHLCYLSKGGQTQKLEYFHFLVKNLKHKYHFPSYFPILLNEKNILNFQVVSDEMKHIEEFRFQLYQFIPNLQCHKMSFAVSLI